MQGKDQSGAIALALLIMGGVGAIVYFLLRKKKQANLEPVIPAVFATNVAQKITAGYNKGFATLSDAEIKKYATWLDRIEQILRTTPKKGKYQTVTPEAINNASALNKLSGDNLRGVVSYWENARGRSIKTNTALDMVYDETSTFSILSGRIYELIDKYQ